MKKPDKQPLIGFSLNMRAQATCRRGHSKWIQLMTIIRPTDTFDYKQYETSIRHYVENAYAELAAAETCPQCEELKLTRWSP